MASLLNQPKRSPKSKSSALQRILDALSPIQQKFLLDEARFKIARAGRRAGKSYVDAALMLYTAEKYTKSPIGYFGLTRDSAKEAVWETLKELIEQCKIDCVINDTQLRIDFPNKSCIRLFGADMEKMKDRFRGRKFKLVIVDECAFFAAVDDIVANVLLATLADLQGTLVMTSSPGELPKGLFYDADQGEQKEQWSRYTWTMEDNPHFQKPSTNPKYKTLYEEELDTICKMKFGGDRNHPVFRREYKGEWVFDQHSLVYPLDKKNILLAEYKIKAPEYAIGVNVSNFGRQGFVVLKYSDYERSVQVVESKSTKCKNLNEFAATIGDLQDTFETRRVLAYLGDYHPEILDDFKQRYPDIPIQASKYEKNSFYQSIIATDMDSGYVDVLDSNPELINEFAKIVRDSAGNEINGQDTLLADAFFCVYLTIYNTTLKSADKPESEDDRMERELAEAAQRELDDWRYEYGND